MTGRRIFCVYVIHRTCQTVIRIASRDLHISRGFRERDIKGVFTVFDNDERVVRGLRCNRRYMVA